MIYPLIRSLLFKIEPERAHYLALKCLGYLPSILFPKIDPHKPVSVMGLNFRHPIGLAAGLDKNAEYITALDKLNFSFIEVGTITPRAQPGNPKPRLFRLPADDALINQMGFNNAGLETFIHNIEANNYEGVLGINIGKNTDTSLNDAASDYCHCLSEVYKYASYITINISSPNSPHLRRLHQEEYLDSLLSQLREKQKALSDIHQRYVPLVVKLSPDESNETLKNLSNLLVKHAISAVIASNTTARRPNCLHTKKDIPQTGGLSGVPLKSYALECLKTLRSLLGNEITFIAAGGIDSATVAQTYLDAGASLLQLYTGLIYRGPCLVNNLLKSLR